jgi:hypothetical protein
MARALSDLSPSTFKALILPGMRSGIQAMQSGDISYDTLEPLEVPFPQHPSKRIGPLVSGARPGDDGDVVNPDYIFNVIELDKKTYVEPRKYILRNMYLLWEVPRAVYAETLDEAMRQVRSLYIQAATPEGAKDDEFFENPSTPSDLVARFDTLLRDVPAREWTKERLEAPVSALIKTIYGQPVTGQHSLWGFHILRWVLCAMKSGPALVPSMVVLGREEVLRRFEVARDVALEWEAKVEKRT